jgi:hypothetical protein
MEGIRKIEAKSASEINPYRRTQKSKTNAQNEENKTHYVLH